MWAKIGDDQIWESFKPLGITIGNELKFDEYISNLFKKAQRKLTVLQEQKKNIQVSIDCDFYLTHFLILNLNIVLSPQCSIVELQIK